MLDAHFTPLPAQPHDDVLFVNTLAPTDHLYDCASRRLAAVEDLLRLLESNPDSGLVDEVARLAPAIAPLVSEAQHLYELALDQRQRTARRPT